MPGSKKTLVLQQRDLRLLGELVTMRAVDRQQAEVIAGFRSKSRSSERLLRLTRAGYLRQTAVGSAAKGLKAVYTLGSKAASALGAPVTGLRFSASAGIGGQIFLTHQLHINEVALSVKYRGIPVAGCRFRRWESFSGVLSEAIPLKPDGYFELDTPQGIRAAFVEVDLGSESVKVFADKVERYLRLATSGAFTERFRLSQFRVLVITTTDARVRNLRQATATRTDKLFFFTTFERTDQHGLFGSHWNRPTATNAVVPI